MEVVREANRETGKEREEEGGEMWKWEDVLRRQRVIERKVVEGDDR